MKLDSSFPHITKGDSCFMHYRLIWDLDYLNGESIKEIIIKT